MKITLNEEMLSEFDKEYFSPRYEGVFFTPDEGDNIFEVANDDAFPFWVFDRYHRYYRILGYLSSLFNNKVLIDIGTRRGHSASSLAFNENNIIYTYNNVDEDIENDAFSKFDNINPWVLRSVDDTPLGNILSREEHAEIVLKSDLIFMDTDPHDGANEKHLFDFLLDNNYNGITLWDDIGKRHVNKFKPLGQWWDEVSSNVNVKSYDITQYSWPESGTGIVCFGEQEVVLR